MKLFDIGTNHGSFTQEYLTKYPTLQAVCIEANPDLCSRLVHKFAFNPNIQTYHYLVSEKSNDYVNFYINLGCDGVSTASEDWVKNSRFSKEPWADPLKIETITLDDLIEATFVPDIIKIDVEGYENTVVKGLTKKIGLVQFEWAEEEAQSVKETCEYLQSIGYTDFAYKFGDLPYTYLPTSYVTLDNLQLFEQLVPSRKEKWGMIYTK